MKDPIASSPRRSRSTLRLSGGALLAAALLALPLAGSLRAERDLLKKLVGLGKGEEALRERVGEVLEQAAGPLFNATTCPSGTVAEAHLTTQTVKCIPFAAGAMR